MREPIQAFIKHLAARNAAARTIATYKWIITTFVEFAGVSDLRTPPSQETISAFIARPRRDGTSRAGTARNQSIAALRAFSRFGRSNLGWSYDPTEGIAFVRAPRRDPVVLSIGEVRRLFTSTVERVRSRERSRDLAILGLLSQTGLRVHELVGLDVEQLDQFSASLVAVVGKGNTRHDVVLNHPALVLVSRWLEDRRSWPGHDGPALFLSTLGRRLSIRAVQHLMQELRKAMGSPKRISPHSLRHTCATLTLALGANLATVGSILRHADLNTTRLYTELIDADRREALARLGTTVPADLVVTTARPEGVGVQVVANNTALDSPEPLVAPRKNPPCVENRLDDPEKAA